MIKLPISDRDSRIERCIELMALTKTTKKDIVALGFSDAQVRGWFSETGSTKARSPSSLQFAKIWHAFDWSPTYITFGKGAKLLSQVGVHEDMFERMDRFEGVLQLALDEAAANKKRYRGALQIIEDRDDQISKFGKTLDLVSANMAALSEQLAKTNRLD